MAVIPVTSNYNVRRRKQSAAAALHDDSPRHTKRSKVEKREVFTPPASPEAMDLFPSVQGCYDDDYEDSVLIGILDFLQRNGARAMCSREISEGLQTEGRVQLLGATPSTVVDASIKQHLKRCSGSNRPNIIQKIADPRYPRKTLYHLANVDPFSPSNSALSPTASLRSSSEIRQRSTAEHDSEASDSESELDCTETLSNDGQGPFAASLATRRRMSLSPSPELEFSLSIDDARRAVATPVASEPPSPSKGLVAKEQRTQLNIALPPSPFITPQASDDEAEHESSLKLPGSIHAFTNSPLTKSLDFSNDDLYDVDVQSPEAVTLDDLDCLLGF